MKSHTEYLTFEIPARMAFRNITREVFYGELDGRRPKRVLVKVLGE